MPNIQAHMERCISLKTLSQTLTQLLFSELIYFEQPFFTEVEPLHVGYVLNRGPADSACDNDGISLEDDAIVDDLIDA